MSSYMHPIDFYDVVKYIPCSETSKTIGSPTGPWSRDGYDSLLTLNVTLHVSYPNSVYHRRVECFETLIKLFNKPPCGEE